MVFNTKLRPGEVLANLLLGAVLSEENVLIILHIYLKTP